MRVYGLSWDVADMSDFLWSGGRLGGPLASIRKDQKVLALSGSQSARAALSVFSSSGSRLFSKPWTDERIMGLGWTDAEDLVAVLENGNVHVYNLEGSYRQFQLGFVNLNLIFCTRAAASRMGFLGDE